MRSQKLPAMIWEARDAPDNVAMYVRNIRDAKFVAMIPPHYAGPYVGMQILLEGYGDSEECEGPEGSTLLILY